ncbi:MAG: aspartate aminotransferase family protein [Thermodesulfobacteriota bacterium]
MDTVEKYAKYVNTAMVARVEPVVVERARAALYVDTSGKQYIDCFSGIAVTNVGHCHPRVIGAARAQMEKLVHCCSYVYYSQPTADLAEKLAAITPGRLQKTFFGNGGAEAIEGALRLAKQFTGRTEFVALQGSFHGRSYATLSVTGNCGRKRRGGPYMVGCTFLPAPYCYRCFYQLEYPSCELRCARALEDVLLYNTYDSVAAFIAEPLLGEGGIIVPPEGFFQEVAKILRKHSILFICDEVQTGFGRTGKMFGIEHYGVEPDIMAMAKGIADGFPLSGFIAREEVADAFKPGDHLSTFGGNPVSCAAALANIQVLEEEGLVQAAWEKGKWLMERLQELASKSHIVGEVRGKGLMIGLELVKDKHSKEPAAEEGKRVRQRCLEMGVLVGLGGTLGNVIRIQPPLVIEQGQMEQVLLVLSEALGEL